MLVFLALLEPQDLMGMALRPIALMGGHDDDFALLRQMGEKLKHLVCGLNIQEIRGFVEEENRRVLCHGTR